MTEKADQTSGMLSSYWGWLQAVVNKGAQVTSKDLAMFCHGCKMLGIDGQIIKGAEGRWVCEIVHAYNSSLDDRCDKIGRLPDNWIFEDEIRLCSKRKSMIENDHGIDFEEYLDLAWQLESPWFRCKNVIELIQIALTLQQVEFANITISKLLEAGVESDDMLVQSGFLLITCKQNHFSIDQVFVRKILEMLAESRNSPDCLGARAIYQAECGNIREAFELSRKSLEIQPVNSFAQAVLAFASSNLGLAANLAYAPLRYSGRLRCHVGATILGSKFSRLPILRSSQAAQLSQ
jgi:hypothetical protein